ncbi:MAG: sigma factor [Pirellulaceae bacterium]
MKSTTWDCVLHQAVPMRDCFKQLVDARNGSLLAYVRGRTSDDADDIAQDVWLKVWHNRAGFTAGSYMAWVLTIAASSDRCSSAK